MPIFLFADDPKYLSNAEIFKIMEGSSTTYNIKSLEELKDISIEDFSKLFYPQLVNHIEYPLVIEVDSSTYLKSFSFDSLAWLELLKGEEFYKNKDYKNALVFYEKAISISDSLYVAYLHAGDCHLMQNNLSEAIANYELALTKNPFDYRPSFYLGTAYSRLQDFEKAKTNYINALILKPRHPNLINVLTLMSNMLNIKINSQTFEPKSLVKQEGDNIEIYLDLQNDPVWMAYAFAKAIWLSEEDVRIKITGKVDTEWNSQAEKQAIFSLMENYYSMVEKGKTANNEYLDLILKIVKEGYLTEFVIYEIASKMDPDIVLKMPLNLRNRIREYVKKYVIVDLN